MSRVEIVEQCIGCDAAVNLNPGDVAAYAIMSDHDYAALRLDRPPLYSGDSGFVAAPVCLTCHTIPLHRVRTLKAHFALLSQARRLTELAGASDIGG